MRTFNALFPIYLWAMIHFPDRVSSAFNELVSAFYFHLPFGWKLVLQDDVNGKSVYFDRF